MDMQCCHQEASTVTATVIKTTMASMEGEEGSNVTDKITDVQTNKGEQTIVIALDASDQAESAVKCKFRAIKTRLASMNLMKPLSTSLVTFFVCEILTSRNERPT